MEHACLRPSLVHAIVHNKQHEAVQPVDSPLSRDTQHSCICSFAVLMAMGSVYWERGAYSALEHLFRQSAEFCSEHEAWKLNVAHTFFMQVRAHALQQACMPSDLYYHSMLTYQHVWVQQLLLLTSTHVLPCTLSCVMTVHLLSLHVANCTSPHLLAGDQIP
jgi:hypothetical protein